MVLQVTIFRILTVIASEVLYNELCPLSPWRQYGNIIISTVQGTSTGIAVTGVIIFEHRVREQLAEHQTLFKLISFKVVVALEAFQNFVFPILADKGFFLPSAPFFVSFNDFSQGLPSFIFIWELTIVSIVFLYSFGFERYRPSALFGAPVLASPGSAFLSSFSTVDIWRGVAYSFKLFSTKPIEYQDSPSKLESNESDDSQGSAFKVQYSATESHNMHQSRY